MELVGGLARVIEDLEKLLVPVAKIVEVPTGPGLDLLLFEELGQLLDDVVLGEWPQEKIGGAKSEPGYVEKRRTPAPADGEGGDVTSRLLKAKRKVRKDLGDRQ